MDFSVENLYRASRNRVVAMLLDERFRTEVCQALEAIDFSINLTQQDTSPTLKIVQDHPLGQGWWTKVFGDHVRVVQQEIWDLDGSAGLKVSSPGKPGSLAGTIELIEDGDTTIERISGKAKVPWPFQKLEGVLVELLEEILAEELAVGQRWLAKHTG